MSYEPRIREIERRLEQVQHELQRAQQLLTETQQSLNRAWMNAPVGSGTGGGQAFWCKSAHTSPFTGVGASGAWPTITPVFDSLDVYQDVGGTLTLVVSSATVRWFFKDACGADKLLAVFANGDGSYDVVSEACTVNS